MVTEEEGMCTNCGCETNNMISGIYICDDCLEAEERGEEYGV